VTIRRQQQDSAQVDEQGESATRPAQGPRDGPLHLRRPFQLRQPLVDQIEADVLGALVARASARLGQTDRLACHFALRSGLRLAMVSTVRR